MTVTRRMCTNHPDRIANHRVNDQYVCTECLQKFRNKTNITDRGFFGRIRKGFRDD